MFKRNRCQDSNIYPEGITNNFSGSYDNIQAPAYMNDCMNSPIVEPIKERICHREFIHEVPHICPINTRIINHHIYKHTYTPSYTCCEENEVCNIFDNSLFL